jgi:hypothetical protein
MENILSTDLPLVKKFTDRISKLETEFRKFKKEQSQRHSPVLKEVKVLNLGDERIRLTREIPIHLEVSSDEVIASFIDAEVTGFGETEAEALDHLKENIISLYFDLIERMVPGNLFFFMDSKKMTGYQDEVKGTGK